MSVSTKALMEPQVAGTGHDGRITRDDVKAKLQSLQGGVDKQVADKKRTAVSAVAGASVVIILLFFLLGRRSGKKKTTIVEIRRV